ncbi:unnamed protein product, partial [marine sediment metagenome]
AADGADYKVTFTAATDQSGDFTVTGGTLTTVPDTGNYAKTGTVSGEFTGTSTLPPGDFTATLTLVTTFTVPEPDIVVTDDLVISGTITATTMTFSGTVTAQDHPSNVVTAVTLALDGGVIVLATGGVVTTPTTDLSGTEFSCDITGSMVVGVTLSAASADPVAGVATVTLTTVADPDTVITVNAIGIGDLTDSSPSTIIVSAGTYSITLVKGWNLISLMLIPEDSDIEKLLSGLDVTGVAAYSPFQEWKLYDPGVSTDLSDMDDGWGYWVDMNTAGTLTVSGYEVCEPQAVPPDYDLAVGWNLIGFKSTTSKAILSYLGPAIAGTEDTPGGTLEAIYGYNASTGVYFIPDINLEPGYGYWLAVNAAGKIYP